MSLSPGTRLGSHEILSAIGAGGMGEVYRARDTKLNRASAVPRRALRYSDEHWFEELTRLVPAK
jgi:serine/threonine protein kinase